MSHVVGTKGQIVISKQIRERLGVEPGWLALERLVDDHVEVYFVSPEHNRSLKGSLAGFVQTGVAPGTWGGEKEKAWIEAARRKVEERELE